MDIYSLLRLNRHLRNHHLKFLGLYSLHFLNKRYLAVHFDPINACNLRCKMCYFTDENYVKKLKGAFDPGELPLLGKAVLNRALKLQIGCGTEPTLYKNLDEVIKLGKFYEVPHISLTTNGNLLSKEKIENYAKLGLNEIILSLHGVERQSYESFMQKGDYDKFHQVLKWISEVKQIHKNLSLRVNYTFNEDNFEELDNFFDFFGQYHLNTLQLRPIKNLGNTKYKNFNMTRIFPIFETTIMRLKDQSKARKITFLAPENLEKLVDRKNIDSLIYPYTYCYISPEEFWHKDFDWKSESYDEYASRKRISFEMLRNAFSPFKKIKIGQTDNLNYKIS